MFVPSASLARSGILQVRISLFMQTMAKTHIKSKSHGQAIRRKMEKRERNKSSNITKKKKPNQRENVRKVFKHKPIKQRDTAKVFDEPEENDEIDEADETNSEINEESTDVAKQNEAESEKKTRQKREKRKFDFEKNSRTIFVGNLPDTLDHKDVAKMFKECGPVESARIRSVIPEKEKLSPKVALITKRLHPKVNSVNAYVVFKNNENDVCLKKALAMNGKVIDGHQIRVDRAQRPKARKETLTSRKKSVFVGNLRFDLRDDDLINHFNKIGSVNYVRLVRDSSSGLGKGFGFVVFDERASVKKALELNETQFKGRSLRVKKVQE